MLLSEVLSQGEELEEGGRMFLGEEKQVPLAPRPFPAILVLVSTERHMRRQTSEYLKNQTAALNNSTP